MAETKRKYESETLALPPLKFVLGEAPASEKDGKGRGRSRGALRPHERADVIERLIARLKQEK